VTRLSLSEGFNAILVVVDYLLKRRYLIACYTTYLAYNLVEIFI
jgi:hypothetical protein